MPILTAETVERFGGLVTWLDAGDLVFGDLEISTQNDRVAWADLDRRLEELRR
jgi:hypothetical protein